jgi:tRNA(Ile)-lysidine synthase
MTAAAGGLPRRFAEAMGALVGPDFPKAIGLAVSGGGDSMAMLHLAAGWARVYGIALRVVTVNHGLRPEAASEAALVASEARGLGLPHDTLRWDGWDGRGNLQDAARAARLRLIDGWRGDLTHVAFAHSRDDQAETFLLRLARGSGVDGLSAMAPLRLTESGMVVLRPLLDVTRAELRHYLTTLRIPFADDPTNDDPAYDRVRIRQAAGVLADLGLTTDRLAATARRMGRARAALAARAADVAARVTTVDRGDVVLDRDALSRVEADTALRLIAAAIRLVTSDPYRPRETALVDALDRALSGGAATLHGAILVPRGPRLWVAREHAAVAGLRAGAGEPWDNRWRAGPGCPPDAVVAALGPEGLPQVGDRDGLPVPVLLSAPAVWQGDRVLACPRADFGPPDALQPLCDTGDLWSRLVSH